MLEVASLGDGCSKPGWGSCESGSRKEKMRWSEPEVIPTWVALFNQDSSWYLFWGQIKRHSSTSSTNFSTLPSSLPSFQVFTTRVPIVSFKLLLFLSLLPSSLLLCCCFCCPGDRWNLKSWKSTSVNKLQAFPSRLVLQLSPSSFSSLTSRFTLVWFWYFRYFHFHPTSFHEPPSISHKSN